MACEEVTIDATDGACRTWVYTPSEPGGSWPAVLFCMDGLGIRPQLHQMAQRMADFGYVVALPDLYYRAGEYGPIDAAAAFASGDVRAVVGPLLQSTDNHRAAGDAGAVLAYLDGRHDVNDAGVATTGYCMGGGISLTVAATYPDKVVAAASFHGGSLATDTDLSPHRVVDRIAGRVYIGAADKDRSYPPEMAAQLVQALMAAGIDHQHDLYRGALHGWTMDDFPVHDPAAAERHWTEMSRFFDESFQLVGSG